MSGKYKVKDRALVILKMLQISRWIREVTFQGLFEKRSLMVELWNNYEKK